MLVVGQSHTVASVVKSGGVVHNAPRGKAKLAREGNEKMHTNHDACAVENMKRGGAKETDG